MARLAAIAASMAAAVNAQGSWNMLAQQFGSSAFGLGMFNDGKTGVILASNTCMQTLDGGNTFNAVECGNLGIFPLSNAICYDTADGEARVAAISGQGIIQFSWNAGANFSTALGSNNAGGVYTQLIFSEAGGKPGGFAIYGPTQDGNTNGVVVSTDGGLSWTALDATAVMGNATAINGYNPTNTTWYMLGQIAPGGGGGSTTTTSGTGGTTTTGTGGTSTGTGGTSTGTGGTTTAAAGKKATRAMPGAAFWKRDASKPLHAPLTDAGYGGVVLKSTNAGKGDWAPVLNLDGVGIAPQAIACQDANNCCFVAADSAYGYVYCTANGGTTFTNTLNVTIAGTQLTDIRPSGPNGYLMAGGTAYTDAAGNAAYLPILMQSTDLGVTWANVTTPFSNFNAAITGLWCLPADNTSCWATLIDPSGAAYVAGNQ